MKIADRYIISELLGPFFLASAGFVLFMLANIIFLLVDQIMNKHVPLTAVIEMLMLRVPAILVLTFPVAMLFSSILGIGRLAADNELMAMRTSGVSLFRLTYPILGFAIFLVAATYLTNEKIAPWATHQSERIVREILLRQVIPMVEPNVFLHGPNNTVYYVGSVEKSTQTLYNVMIFEGTGSIYPRMTVANKAHYDGVHLTLYQGSIHQYGPDGLTRYESSFQEMIVPMTIDASNFTTEDKTPFEMNTNELRDKITQLKRSGIATQSLATDYHFKFSMPFGCLVAGLIGFPLSVRFPHGGKLIGVAISILLLFVYYCLFAISRSLGTMGVLVPWVAAWLPNVALGVSGFFLLYSQEKIRS